MAPNLSLFSVNAILILSTDDRTRILTKYYSAPHHGQPQHNSTSGSGAGGGGLGSNPYPTVKEQKAFEKGLLEKTNKQSSDIILYDGRVVVFKMEGDVMLYVVGGPEENEILLFGVVLALRDSLAILLKYAILSIILLSSSRHCLLQRKLCPYIVLIVCAFWRVKQELDRQTDSNRKLRPGISGY